MGKRKRDKCPKCDSSKAISSSQCRNCYEIWLNSPDGHKELYNQTQSSNAKFNKTIAMKMRWQRGDFANSKVKLPLSEECKNRLSLKAKQNYAAGVYTNVHRFYSTESRARISEKIKNAHKNGSYNTERYREVHRAIIIEVSRRPEVRRKLSISMKNLRTSGRFDNVFQSPTKPELLITRQLDMSGVPFITQYRFSNATWRHDFYLPLHDIIIEIDGDYWHSLPSVQGRDKRKNEWFVANNKQYIRILVSDLMRDGPGVAYTKYILPFLEENYAGSVL